MANSKIDRHEPTLSVNPIFIYCSIAGAASIGLLLIVGLVGYFLMNSAKKSEANNDNPSAPVLAAQVTPATIDTISKSSPATNEPEPAKEIIAKLPEEVVEAALPIKVDPEVKQSEMLPKKDADLKPLQKDEMPRLEVQKKLPGVLDAKQIAINKAIERGVQYLKTHPAEHPSFGAGYTALAGLALLECGVPANDPQIQQAAVKIRYDAVKLSHTYQVSLAILFLDRLGEPSDRPIIQGLAMRLLAGQTGSGGWNYQCPLLPPSDMVQLFKFLESNRPPALQKMHEEQRAKGWANPLALSTKSNPNDPFRKYEEIMLTKGIVASPAPKANSKTTLTTGIEMPAPEPKVTAKSKAKAEPNVAKPIAPMKAQALPQHLRNLPVVQLQAKGQPKLTPTIDDNSNTQFALLALWVARRHEVPTEQALLLAQLRFRSSQMPDGHWNYRPQGGPFPPPTPAMTAVGLLGLALGDGAKASLSEDRPPASILDDRDVQKGLQFLSLSIGTPGDASPPQGLYFLWSVERIGVLYNLKLIQGKDWYGWGSQLLVAEQNNDGSWMNGQYHGFSAYLDTSLALLFLKRVNLVRDLTDSLRLTNPILDPYSDGLRK